MFRSSFMLMLLVFVVCQFCERDFESLGRHSWRCKQRIHRENERQTASPSVLVQQSPASNPPKLVIPKRSGLKCCCGKICKGERGLKMHQRSCRLIHDLDAELQKDLTEQNDSNVKVVNEVNENVANNLTSVKNNETSSLKKGIRLPKRDFEWATANEYFKFTLQPITTQDLNASIQQLNDTVYGYFAENFGYNNHTPDKSFVNKYKSCSVKELKKSLKELKLTKDNPEEIKYVAHLLRGKLKSPSNDSSTDGCLDACDTSNNINHDKYIQKNFWGYVKNVLNKSESVLPSFNQNQCFEYFTKTLAALNPSKLFNIPSWVPSLSDPEIQFDLEPPTYQQITNIIRRMKASGSPCPLDQISIICFKRCPFLRSYLADLIRAVWSSGSVPSEWKKACTVLIHKKGDTNEPSNFRPITLQSIPLKVFTSYLRNSMYSFLNANNYIEQRIQKGFTPNISGTLEHTAQMANIINKARIKQRSLVITLLDLKNAFGEVHHNLITSVLDYHHIPEHIKLIINSLYTDFKTSIITSNFQTPLIPVGRGVLQGDCLSPLLFNMCFNTFIQHIKAEKYRQFGFSFQLLNPVHWFQFADDAAVVTTQESENQHLLNRFSVWCQWSDMFIRVEKCSTFGIKKSLTKSIQYLPKLIITNKLIPTVKSGNSFKYLGRYFNFHMSDEDHKLEITSLIEDIMSDIDSKPLHPKNKLILYNRYVLSKISWHFTVSNISQTWVKENIDPIANNYIRRWLEVPISGTLSAVFMSRNKFGLNICPPSIKFAQCQTVMRNALKKSPNTEINELWKSTSTNKNIQYDAYASTKEVLRDFRTNQEDKLKNKLLTQGFFFSCVDKFALSHLTKLWSVAQSNLPKNIFNFSIRYINNSLPTGQNLKRWNISSMSSCSNCLSPETLLHVVAGCKSYLNRFTWRHDSILNFLAKTLLSVNNISLYVDIPGYKCPSIITGDQYRPDILLVTSDNTLYVAELTVGYESNLRNNSSRKKKKYSELVKDQTKNYRKVVFVNISMSCLGVFADESRSLFNMLDKLGVDQKQQDYCVKHMTTIAIRTTYYIFCRRNKEWENPEILLY